MHVRQPNGQVESRDRCGDGARRDEGVGTPGRSQCRRQTRGPSPPGRCSSASAGTRRRPRGRSQSLPGGCRQDREPAGAELPSQTGRATLERTATNEPTGMNQTVLPAIAWNFPLDTAALTCGTRLARFAPNLNEPLNGPSNHVGDLSIADLDDAVNAVRTTRHVNTEERAWNHANTEDHRFRNDRGRFGRIMYSS